MHEVKLEALFGFSVSEYVSMNIFIFILTGILPL